MISLTPGTCSSRMFLTRREELFTFVLNNPQIAFRKLGCLPMYHNLFQQRFLNLYDTPVLRSRDPRFESNSVHFYLLFAIFLQSSSIKRLNKGITMVSIFLNMRFQTHLLFRDELCFLCVPLSLWLFYDGVLYRNIVILISQSVFATTVLRDG